MQTVGDGVVMLLQENGASPAGWSNSEVSDVGSAGLVHGPWGNDVTDVSIDIPIPAGMSTCEVRWRSWAADSRDGEVDRVLIDGTEVWSMASQCYSGSDGWEQGPPDFPNPWDGENGQVCFQEVRVHVACSGSMNLRFVSGIDQHEADESWAFSGVRVVARSSAATGTGCSNNHDLVWSRTGPCAPNYVSNGDFSADSISGWESMNPHGRP